MPISGHHTRTYNRVSIVVWTIHKELWWRWGNDIGVQACLGVVIVVGLGFGRCPSSRHGLTWIAVVGILRKRFHRPVDSRRRRWGDVRRLGLHHRLGTCLHDGLRSKVQFLSTVVSFIPIKNGSATLADSLDSRFWLWLWLWLWVGLVRHDHGLGHREPGWSRTGYRCSKQQLIIIGPSSRGFSGEQIATGHILAPGRLVDADGLGRHLDRRWRRH